MNLGNASLIFNERSIFVNVRKVIGGTKGVGLDMEAIAVRCKQVAVTD